MDITDTNDVPITYLSFTQAESTDGTVFVIRVKCLSGLKLVAQDVADVRVLARRHGTVDAFVDIATSPIALTPYAGTSVDFDVKLHTNAVTAFVSTAVEIRVTYNL